MRGWRDMLCQEGALASVRTDDYLPTHRRSDDRKNLAATENKLSRLIRDAVMSQCILIMNASK